MKNKRKTAEERPLTGAEFPSFFEAVHGQCQRPFPWQERLLEHVLEKGWANALDVPTGAGKTAAIDVAVFHLAMEAEGEPGARRAPIRTLFVVDRRLVVDDAYERAARIARALTAPTDPTLVRVARALATLAEKDGPPLRAVRLRGGVPREPDWVRSPLQPTVVVSTVDQVGSRLLFRGYGVSDSMKPVHAGLLGTDSLILLDEAHLSRPFLQTVRDAHRLEPRAAPPSCDRRSQLVSLSATQQDSAPRLLSAADYKHPVLGPRLRASKVAQLVTVAAAACEPQFVKAFVDRALELAAREGVKVVAVIANRVRRAREIHRQLLERGEAVLLTGRARELDRQAQLQDLLPRIRAGRVAHTATTLFVVATQCVEAGADLDFDALVTELAPLDALRQRFGRLNRMGRPFDAPAYVLAARDQIGKRAAADPIYGAAPANTWAYLLEHAPKASRTRALPSIDFGIEASKGWLPTGAKLTPCLSRPAEAPILLSPHLMLWNYTSRLPAADPLVSLYLHGLGSAAGDVQIVWRSDVDEQDRARTFALLDACPPSSLETVSLPLGEARRWLFGAWQDESDGLADVEGAEAPERPTDQQLVREVIRWSATGGSMIHRYGLRAGDVIVVPSARAGCDAWGWNPASVAPVTDLGRAANCLQRARDVFRLSRASPELGADDHARAARLHRLSELSDEELLTELCASAQFPEGTPARQLRVLRAEDGSPLALERRLSRDELPDSTGPSSDSTTESDKSLVGNVSVTLVDHSRGVEATARDFARALPPKLATSIIIAAFLHDAGKAWVAFKRWLYGGDELAAEFGPALAKSGQRLDEAARTRAGLPKGARHELASLRFAAAHPRLAEAPDPELVLWLIGTHHGHGRPFFPSVDWPPQEERCTVDLGDGEVVASQTIPAQHLASGWVDMFHRLLARYGMWGLAHMEATLRLADHRRSEEEQR